MIAFRGTAITLSYKMFNLGSNGILGDYTFSCKIQGCVTETLSLKTDATVSISTYNMP